MLGLDHNILGVLVSLNPWRHAAAASCCWCWCRLGPVTEPRKPVLLSSAAAHTPPPPHLSLKTKHSYESGAVVRWCCGAVVRWCCGAAAPSSSTAPQQDVCCGVRGMALTPTLAPGLCLLLLHSTSGHCGQSRAGIKWSTLRGPDSWQCLSVSWCWAAVCWLEHGSRPTPFLRRTG